MHLQSVEEYEKSDTLKKPAYWDLAYEISDSAVDRPEANANTGTAAPEEQVGLRVRAAPRRGQILGILPQRARLRIGQKKEKDLWGKIIEIESGDDMYPPQAGGYVADDAKTGWIFLGEEHGNPVVKQVLSDSQLDRVVVLPKPFPINAGDLIGHLGQYDLLSPPTAGNRMVHIEVLCDDQVESYLKESRTYVDEHAKDEDHIIVRIDKQVKLYKGMGREGASAPETGVVQIYPVSVLAAGKKEDQAQETVAGGDGKKAHWWMIDSADVRHAPIEGWVRETNHAGGRVTLEAPHQWVDFRTLEEAHDPTHTMFASAQGWIDYKLDAPVPEVAALAKLSPAASEIYRAAYPTGSGAQAADELRKASKDKWRQLVLSRLIVRHESEWANPAKWDSLFAQVEERTSHDPALDEEKKRIAKLVWWSDVQGKVEGFPSAPNVFHIHPIGLLGNFARSDLITIEMLKAVEPANTDAYYRSIIGYMNMYAKVYSVDTPRRIAHFLSQAAHESGLKALEEGLTYSAKNMRKTFGCKGGPKRYNDSCDDCTQGRLREKLWSQASRYAGSPESLANYVYAMRNGNGDEGTGEGYKYRGRGFIQVTGKAGYRSFQKTHNERSPDDIQDFVTNPDLLISNVQYGVESAFVFWFTKGLNETADAGTVESVTQVVNGGQNGLADRRRRYNNVALLLLLPEDI